MATIVRVKFPDNPKTYDYTMPPTNKQTTPAVGDYVVTNARMKTNSAASNRWKWEDLNSGAKLEGFGVAEIVEILDSKVGAHSAEKMYIGHIAQDRMRELDKRRHLAAKAAKEAEEAAEVKKQRDAKIAELKLELGQLLVGIQLNDDCAEWETHCKIKTITRQIKDLSNDY